MGHRVLEVLLGWEHLGPRGLKEYLARKERPGDLGLLALREKKGVQERLDLLGLLEPKVKQV